MCEILRRGAPNCRVGAAFPKRKGTGEPLTQTRFERFGGFLSAASWLGPLRCFLTKSLSQTHSSD